MATSGPLEDHITCCVCIDVYRDPQALKCLHTLCRECVDQLEEGGRVQCPECREYTDMPDVKKDFKTEGLVDLYNTKKIASVKKIIDPEKTVQPQKCELCEEVDKPVISRCENCEQYLCQTCDKLHAKMKRCKGHKVLLIQDIVEKNQGQLKDTLEMLVYEKELMSKISSNVDEMMSDIHKEKFRQLGEIVKYKESMVAKIEQHCTQLTKAIKKSNDTVIEKCSPMKQVCSKGENDLESHIKLVTDLIEGHDISALTESANNIDVTIRRKVKHMKGAISGMDINLKSKIKITYGEDWDPKYGIDILDDTSEMENNITYGEDLDPKYGIDILDDTSEMEKKNETKSPMLQQHPDQYQITTALERNNPVGNQQEEHVAPNVMQLFNNTYTSVAEAKLGDHEVKRICKVKDQIWGVDSSDILVYNDKCELVKKISLHIGDAKGITYVQNFSVVVAHDGNGIHEFNTKGNYKGCICAIGRFSDVFCNPNLNKLYALQYYPFKQSVIVFSLNADNVWNKEETIELNDREGSCYDKLWIHGDKIYVSDSYNITVYTMTGDLVYLAGKSGKGDKHNNLYNSGISGVDAEGSIIIADSSDNRVLVYQADRKQWQVLELAGHKGTPRQVIVDNRNTLWMLTYDSVLKYNKQ